MEQTRFEDTGETIFSVIEDFLVVCPSCNGLATVRKIDVHNQNLFAPRRFACCHCGLTKDWAEKSVILENRHDPPVDSYFRLPLFLTAPCCGHTLWAYNLKHLNLIETYVQATLRTHVKHEKYGWNNRGLVNRLPQWMLAANNREQVLKTITKLKLALQNAT